MESSVINFGAGRVFLGEKEVGDLRDITVEISREIKEYRGPKGFARDAAIAGESLTIKASTGTFDPGMVASIMGGTTTVGYLKVITETSDTAPGTTTVVNSANWTENLDVTHPTYGRMTKVAAAPALGEFSAAAGVYTWNASETGIATITYRYTIAASGKNTVVSNSDKRQAPQVRIVCWLGYSTQAFGIEIPAAVITKWSMGAKQEDFLDPQPVEGFAVQPVAGTYLYRIDTA